MPIPPTLQQRLNPLWRMQRRLSLINLEIDHLGAAAAQRFRQQLTTADTADDKHRALEGGQGRMRQQGLGIVAWRQDVWRQPAASQGRFGGWTNRRQLCLHRCRQQSRTVRHRIAADKDHDVLRARLPQSVGRIGGCDARLDLETRPADGFATVSFRPPRTAARQVPAVG